MKRWKRVVMVAGSCREVNEGTEKACCAALVTLDRLAAATPTPTAKTEAPERKRLAMAVDALSALTPLVNTTTMSCTLRRACDT